MRKRFKQFITLLLALSLMLSLAACGGETESSGGDSSGGETSSTDEEVISSKDTLVRSINFAEPGSYNNWRAGATQAASPIFEQIVEPMVRNYDGELIYELCESYEIQDGTTVIVNLREDVYFHNGDEMTPEDVIFSAELCRNSGGGRATWEPVDTVEEIDENTVQLNLKYETSTIELILANWTVTSKAYYEEVGDQGFGTAPLGTGYFMWDADGYIPGDSVTLRSFDRYWGEHGTINTLTFRFIAETSQALIELENGNVDVFMADGSTLATIEGNENYKTSYKQDSILEYCGFNFNSEKVQDVRVRQAVCYAINREDIITGARDGMGITEYGMIASSHGEKYNSAVEDYYPYDPEKAAELMADMGYTKENPLVLKLMTDTQAQRSLEAQMIKNMLDEVGFSIEIQTFEAAAFNDILQGGDPEWYDMVIRGMGSTVGEPLMQVKSILSPDATATGNNPMHLALDSHERAQEFNDKINEALRTVDPEEQLPIVQELQEIEREIIPCCWLFDRETYYVMNAKLMGTFQPGAGMQMKDCYWVE